MGRTGLQRHKQKCIVLIYTEMKQIRLLDISLLISDTEIVTRTVTKQSTMTVNVKGPASHPVDACQSFTHRDLVKVKVSGA